MDSITYEQVVISNLTEDDLGRTVMCSEKWDKTYGIITGFTKTNIFVHFARAENSFMMNEKGLFFANFKNK